MTVDNNKMIMVLRNHQQESKSSKTKSHLTGHF